MKHPSILVIGDLILDRYLEGQTHRISPEAPVPVVALEREWETPGGAGNVAAALAGLGCRVTLAGALGADEYGRRLRWALGEAGVAECVLVEIDGIRTVCKTRVVAGGRQQMLRIDQDGDPAAYRRVAADLVDTIVSQIEDHDVVVLSDYDKGIVTRDLAVRVVGKCRALGVPCVVDPKKADFSMFAGATVLTPNLVEACRALSLDNPRSIAVSALKARETLALMHLLVTRGSEGMILASADGITEFPAEVREVADVTGAGDTVTATVAAALGAGINIKEACRRASVAAGIAVGHRGCYVVKADELEVALRGGSPKVRDKDSARRWVADLRSHGRKVVFTNGCFDILHAGHLACLEQSRRLGDALVVGLNSDASVRLNKGSSRPIITEHHRAALLAGLACVDAVVLFDELTPESLVRQLDPDFLVKGGDYVDQPIAGADFVREQGGRVVTIPLVDGLSTTTILRKATSNESDG